MNDSVYLLFRTDGSGKFPVYRTAEGKTALIMFTCLDLAKAFVHGRGRSLELQAIEYSRKNFVEWLEEAARKYAATEIALDPAPEASLRHAKVAAISALLIESTEVSASDKTVPSFNLGPRSKKS